MLSIRAGAKPDMSDPNSFSRLRIASPMGSIISVVELLDVHIDKHPVAIIKLSMIFGRLVPIVRIVAKAMRL
jgi:hypothetical protein